MKEILQMTAPQEQQAQGWHLERMVASQLDSPTEILKNHRDNANLCEKIHLQLDSTTEAIQSMLQRGKDMMEICI